MPIEASAYGKKVAVVREWMAQQDGEYESIMDRYGAMLSKAGVGAVNNLA